MQQDERGIELAGVMRASCLGMRVEQLHRLVSRAYTQRLRPLGLSLPQMEILCALVLAGRSVKLSELAGWLSVERSTISRNVALMEARGWVAVADVSRAGRSMAVVITESGTNVLVSARAAWGQAQAVALGLLGPDAPAAIDSWLDALAGEGPAEGSTLR